MRSSCSGRIKCVGGVVLCEVYLYTALLDLGIGGAIA